MEVSHSPSREAFTWPGSPRVSYSVRLRDDITPPPTTPASAAPAAVSHQASESSRARQQAGTHTSGPPRRSREEIRAMSDRLQAIEREERLMKERATLDHAKVSSFCATIQLRAWRKQLMSVRTGMQACVQREMASWSDRDLSTLHHTKEARQDRAELDSSMLDRLAGSTPSTSLIPRRKRAGLKSKGKARSSSHRLLK